MTSSRGRMSPPSALGRAVSESCCFERAAAGGDELDRDDSEVNATWLTGSTSGKVHPERYVRFSF